MRRAVPLACQIRHGPERNRGYSRRDRLAVAWTPTDPGQLGAPASASQAEYGSSILLTRSSPWRVR